MNRDNKLVSKPDQLGEMRRTSGVVNQVRTSMNGQIFKQTPKNVPSVFKSLASAKKKRGKEQTYSSLNFERKATTGSKSLLSSDLESERQAYFMSKKMRGAPQITPLAPL